MRTTRTEDYGFKISEFPHLIVNQARVLDYFAEAAADGPARIRPDYGVEFLGLEVHDDHVEVRVRTDEGERPSERSTSPDAMAPAVACARPSAAPTSVPPPATPGA